jgi:hypothetical protein
MLLKSPHAWLAGRNITSRKTKFKFSNKQNFTGPVRFSILRSVAVRVRQTARLHPTECVNAAQTDTKCVRLWWSSEPGNGYTPCASHVRCKPPELLHVRYTQHRHSYRCNQADAGTVDTKSAAVPSTVQTDRQTTGRYSSKPASYLSTRVWQTLHPDNN